MGERKSGPASSDGKFVSGRTLLWITAGVGLLLVVAFTNWVDLKWLHEQAQSLNGFVVFLLLAVLPLVGMPASALYIVGGAKYGYGWGLVVVVAVTAIHLVASWWIAHSWLKRPIETLLHKLGRRTPQVPKGESAPFCLMIALVPGLSYTLKNYLLVLAGVPFRVFFWTCLPAHVLSASLGVLFGGFTASMTTPRIIFLVAYGVFFLSLSAYVVRRLKWHKHLHELSEMETARPHDTVL